MAYSVKVLNHCACTTLALHTYVFATTDAFGSSDDEGTLFQNMYLGFVQKVIAAMVQGSRDVIMQIGGHDISCDSGGQAIGFKECVNALHKSVAGMLASEWDARHRLGSFCSSFARETLSLQDVVTFVLTFARLDKFIWEAGILNVLI